MAGRRAAPKVTATWEGNLTELSTRKLDRLTARTLDELDELGARAASYARGIAPVRSGTYRAGILSRRNVVGTRVGVEAKSIAPHASIVERGRKPGKRPPASKLAQNLGIGQSEAYVIAARIGRKKTKGHGVIRKTRKAMAGELARKAEELGRWLNDLDDTT